MIIKIKECSQYIIFLLTLCGQLPKEDILNSGIFAPDYIRKAFRKMELDHMIRNFKVKLDENEVNVVRLRDSWSMDIVKEISPELAAHYDMLVGLPGERFKGNARYRERLYKQGKLIKMIYDSGMMVDFIRHNHTPNFFGKNGPPEGGRQPKKNMFDVYYKDQTIFDTDGKLLSPVEIISRIDKNEPCFFTNKALFYQDAEWFKNRRQMMSRSYGTYVRGKTFYTVYYFRSARESWMNDAEYSNMTMIQTLQKRFYPEAREGRGSAILYVPAPSVVMDLYHIPKKAKRKITPNEVYDKANIIPISENHINLRNLLLIENWKEKCKSILLEENASKEGMDYDGMLDGQEVHILLDNDMCKIRSLSRKLKDRPCILVIHPWQRELIEDQFGKNTEVVEIENTDFNDLVEEIENL